MGGGGGGERGSCLCITALAAGRSCCSFLQYLYTRRWRCLPACLPACLPDHSTNPPPAPSPLGFACPPCPALPCCAPCSISVDDMRVEEMTAAHYLAFKEKLVPMETGKQQLESKSCLAGSSRLGQAGAGWRCCHLRRAPQAAVPQSRGAASEVCLHSLPNTLQGTCWVRGPGSQARGWHCRVCLCCRCCLCRRCCLCCRCCRRLFLAPGAGKAPAHPMTHPRMAHRLGSINRCADSCT